MFSQTYKNVLVGHDGSEQAMEAFKKALAVAKRNDGTVYVASIIDPQVYSLMGYSPLNEGILDQQTADVQKIIDECKAYAKAQGYEKVRGIISYGSAKEAMARTLPEKYDIDLIMAGQSGLNAVERFVTGSVASFIIKEATRDVLIVHPSKTKAD